jgi:AcrR family transcriptional regulator
MDQSISRKSERRPRAKLSPDAIELAALSLIGEVGLDGFSMRKLAAKLGCEAMSLYHHFASVAHLYEALVDRLVREADLLPASRPWRERLVHAASGFRAMAYAHPRFFPYVALFRMNTPTCIAWLDGTIQIFRDAGLSDADAARYFRSFSYYLVGAFLDETSGYAQGPGAVEPVSAEVIARDFPAVAAVAPYFQPAWFDRTYETGLHHLLEGIERGVAAAGGEGGHGIGAGETSRSGPRP